MQQTSFFTSLLYGGVQEAACLRGVTKLSPEQDSGSLLYDSMKC